MSKFQLYLFSITVIFCLSFVLPDPPTAASKYKCLIQVSNYTGEGPYIVVSALDADNMYLETLHVLGEDEEWYEDITEWWSFFEEKKEGIDAITRPSILAGGRAVFVLTIDDALVDKGNQIRFETAVEDQKYVMDDVILPLTSETLQGKFEGTGYIRYVRMIPNN